ncbi:MAG: hypothetical protein WAW13_02590 [Minisyncoccia bacterium]
MRTIFLSMFLAFATPVWAFVPEVVVQESLLDIKTIEDPTLAQTFYGNLVDFPHTYQIIATKPFHLFVHIKVPDIESSANNISGIIIKEPEGKGRVQEVTRLKGNDALWESTYEWWSMDAYRNGPSFEQDLGPGTYRIEVSTPDNREKYVLVVGTRDEMVLGYFGTVRRLVDVKAFFEKSRLRIVESPLVFVPLIGIGGLCALWYKRRVRTMRGGILK